jgi:hypothetical protein
VTLGYLQNNYSTAGTTNNAMTSLSNEIDALNKQMAKLDGTSGSTTGSAGSTAIVTAASQPAGGGSNTPAAVAAAPVQGSGANAAGQAAAAGKNDSPTPASHSATAVATAGNTQQPAAQPTTVSDSQTQEALQSANTYAQSQVTAQAVSAANAYTNQALAGYVTTDAFNQYQQQVNVQFQQQDKRIEDLGAMSAAATQMAINTAGLSGDNRVGVGLGTYGGRQAASVGYQHMFSNQKASVSAGVSSGNGETSGGVGFGFSW